MLDQAVDGRLAVVAFDALDTAEGDGRPETQRHQPGPERLTALGVGDRVRPAQAAQKRQRGQFVSGLPGRGHQAVEARGRLRERLEAGRQCRRTTGRSMPRNNAALGWDKLQYLRNEVSFTVELDEMVGACCAREPSPPQRQRHAASLAA